MDNTQFSNKNKGIGSFFPYVSAGAPKLKLHPSNFFPRNKMLFYTGRQAIKHVIEVIRKERNVITIWLPEYYCQHVSTWIKNNYTNIKLYTINPKNRNKTLNLSEFANDNDIVLVNNFWGISSCNINRGKINSIVIEDHSHGWLSSSCINSSADYCIASLRKSVPIPLGGIAWRPDGKKIDSKIQITNDPSFKGFWNNILEGMKLKEAYEEKTIENEIEKKIFLEIINQEEQKMHANLNLVPLNKKHEAIIEDYLQTDYLSLKKDNLAKVHSLLQPSNYFEVINSLPQGFGIILYLENEKNMNRLRSFLISHKIYPSLLWPGNNSKYGYYLNIHIDFRYNKGSMEYICKVLNTFKNII